MAVAVVGADKKGGKRRLASAAMFALLGASLLGACAPVGPQTVEPIVEQANTTEAGATIPTYAELVAEAMGGGFDPDSLEPGRAAALEQLRQTFFIREYDTDGDRQLDGPILSELGENTVQWAVDGVTPYLAGKEINDVYGGGTDTALLVSGFRPGEPLVLSVAGANAELANQGVPANGKYLVVMSPTQAVVTDERSNPVAEVGADGVWRVVGAVAVVTEVPTETPEPTPEPTEIPATATPEPTATMAITVGMQNEAGQWWDGEAWQSQQSVGDFVFTGTEFQLKKSDSSYESIVFPVELVTAIQEGRLSLSDFAPITVDNTVYEAYESNGTMWRMMDVVYEGVRHIGAFKEVFGESEIVNISDESLVTSNVETRVYGQSFNVSLTDISDARILEMQKVNYVGNYDGVQKSVPSFYVTFEYLQGGGRSIIRTSSYGGTIWSMGDQKPMSFSMVIERSRNGSVHIGLSHPVNVPTETWLNGIKGGDDLANPMIVEDLPLALIAMPPKNIADNLDPDNPGRVTSIFFR